MRLRARRPFRFADDGLLCRDLRAGEQFECSSAGVAHGLIAAELAELPEPVAPKPEPAAATLVTHDAETPRRKPVDAPDDTAENKARWPADESKRRGATKAGPAARVQRNASVSPTRAR